MAPDTKKATVKDVGALLDAGDGAVVTLVAGDTQLAAHRAVLTARSPVFEDMFRPDSLEGSSGRVTIIDVEGSVLRQLLAYCYTLKITDTIPPDMTIKEKSSRYLAALLDGGDGALVTLVAGDTQLAAHRAVLAAMSPVFEAMFRLDTLEARSGRVTIPDIEGPVLRQLLAYCYTLNAPQLAQMASQLLSAADKYGLSELKTECEQQMVADLFVGNVAAAAVLAVRHSCPSLTQAALTFIKAHFVHVVGTKGWADAMRNQPEYLIEVSRLLAEPPPEIRSLSGEEKGKKLIQAAKDGSWEQLWMLMMAGADVGVRDGNWTPLHYAAEYGHMEAVKCLLESGAEVDSTGACQYTPLHTSAINGHTAVVQLLVASSADPNFKDELGRTALHWAALAGHAEVVSVLLETGANREIRDKEKKSPLDLATEKNHQKVIELLTGS